MYTPLNNKKYVHDVHHGAPPAQRVAVHRGQQRLGQHLEQLLRLLCVFEKGNGMVGG